ncbi:hypothetical protein WJX73_001432 [Symbiochloris irregularis]|uniref:RNA helicase n=1 Tax=Symbiochloris irregularis TaxID=706552 RepID=A0AAW1PYW7_9CHLO
MSDIAMKTVKQAGSLDLVGRARTGCGKTLAFVLPIVQRLGSSQFAKVAGRGPQVIVLAPTRELAKQVHADFEHVGAAFGLKTVCLYGGSQYGPQEYALRKGIDVVVGTPGRVKDHLERGTLNLVNLKYRVLDECDEMLNMGFVDDVEKILSAGGPSEVQTMLFSATLPSWVKDITRRFLKPTHRTIDLVGNQKMKASDSVRHLILPCHYSQRTGVATDVIKCYAAMGRAIVFTDTKREADELSNALGETLGAKPLHGDIPQHQREVTLAGFRKGQFQVLVATDVAARGLDISGVELVLQTGIPKEHETYIHRSGRTGRAGSTGTSVMMVDKRREGLVPLIERRAGVKFERIGSPQPQDMARIAGERAVEALQDVDDSAVEPFLVAADTLLASEPDARTALARAIAKLSGHTAMQARSLLTAHEDYTTLLFDNGYEIQRPGFVFGFLKKSLAEDKVEEVKRMTLTQDGLRAVFDVPTKLVKEFMAACGTSSSSDEAQAPASMAKGSASTSPTLTIATTLPELKAQPMGAGGGPSDRQFGGGGGRSFGGGSRGGFGRGGGFRGRGGSSSRGGRFGRGRY